MGRSLTDRWTDTTAFRALLLCSAIVVLPVLSLGILMTVGLLAVAVLEQSAALEGAFIVVASIGGALGMVGYLRAHWGLRHLDRHNVTATLVCLAIGVATALVVTGSVLLPAIGALLIPSAAVFDWWQMFAWFATPTLFGLANVVWALAGVAWMQRLTRRYAERTGRGFDSLPVMLLFVAIVLATAAALTTTTL